MENITGSEIPAAPAPEPTAAPAKAKSQRTYHVRNKNDKTDVTTVVVYKGVLYAHPDKFCEECKTIVFVPGEGVLIDSDYREWVQIADPRR